MDQLFTPAHLHLAINHAPIIGLAVACIPLLIGIFFRSRGAMASGLVCVLLCVATVPAIMETGEEARESFAEGSLEPDIDTAGNSALREHSRHARTTAPVAYAAGLLALVALIGLGKFPRQAAWLAWAVLVGNAATIALAVWTAEAGGRIRHPEFRPHGQQAPDFSKTSSSMLRAVSCPASRKPLHQLRKQPLLPLPHPPGARPRSSLPGKRPQPLRPMPPPLPMFRSRLPRPRLRRVPPQPTGCDPHVTHSSVRRGGGWCARQPPKERQGATLELAGAPKELPLDAVPF